MKSDLRVYVRNDKEKRGTILNSAKRLIMELRDSPNLKVLQNEKLNLIMQLKDIHKGMLTSLNQIKMKRFPGMKIEPNEPKAGKVVEKDTLSQELMDIEKKLASL